jgi:cytochrome c oxidase subunit I+III
VPATAGRMAALWADPPGLRGQLMAVQNDTIGKRMLLTGCFFLLLGGSVDSLVMRLQLAVPENDLVSAELYNELFTNHGSVTMFLVILPIVEGFAIWMLPFLLGTREMPFPRLGAYSYFTYLMGGLFYYSSTLFQLVPDAGWFAYTPLSLTEFSPDLALDFWVLGLSVAEVAAIAAGIEIIITILKFRAPGMTLARMPLFAWAMLVTAFMILFAFTTLIVGSLLLELSRSFDMKFFNPEAGGSSLLWQHLFWIFGHPEVYIQFLPAAGIVSMVVPVFVGRRIAGYTWLVAAFVAIGFMSFALWAHHMFAVGLPPVVLSFFSAASMAIGVPAGIQIFAWIATFWEGRPAWKTPLLFSVGFIVTFVLGGITGIMVASAPVDLQAHDSYFVVGHLHYVLIGGVVFPFFAGAYYWLPKFTGRLLNERLGHWNFWLMFAGLNVAFFPMHIVGLQGMPRRVYTYDADTGWGVYNLISTVGAFILFAGVLTFIANLIYSHFRGVPAGANPWNGDTLEWSVTSPPPNQGFSVPPIVHSRHPLWDQTDLHEGDPRLEAFLHGLAEWPLKWRAALITSVNDAEPEEVIRVAGPSIWPFVAACGTVLLFIGEMLHRNALLLFSAVVLSAAVVCWNRPEPVPVSEAEEEAFEAEHGVPVRTGGSRTLGAWGMALALLVAGTAFATLLLSYFYLRLENETWPPQGVALPGLRLAALSLLALFASSAAMTIALRAIRAGQLERLKAGIGAAIALTVAACAVQLTDFERMGFDAQSHAYGSIFYTLGGFMLVMAVIAVIIDGAVLYQARNDRFTRRRHAPVLNAARFCAALNVVWLVGFATLYLSPRLT